MSKEEAFTVEFTDAGPGALKNLFFWALGKLRACLCQMIEEAFCIF